MCGDSSTNSENSSNSSVTLDGINTMRSLVFALAASIALQPLGAQNAAADRARVLALADSALVYINQGNSVALTDLMTEEAIIASVRDRDGTSTHSVRTRAAERARVSRSTIVERGFRGEAKVSGPIATVWLPYDLYVDGQWSHCGVDTFTFMKTGGAWKIVALAYSVEQPPACERHPDGPPRR
jgi:hypothetical protein